MRFVDDLLVEGGVMLVTVQPELMKRVVDVAKQFGLDFDDAYQYVAAEHAEATMVSYDADFDRTAHKRRTPMDVLGDDAVTLA